MNDSWKADLRVDPLPALLGGGDEALDYFVRRDLLDEKIASSERLWEMDEASHLADKQQANGSWRYPGSSEHPASNANYDLLETYRTLRILVEMYGFQRAHPTLVKAAEYVFSCQTEAGDIRGILGNQFMPYYHGAMLELLIKAGFSDDLRVIKGLEWLISKRQIDGGWVIPLQLVPARLKTSAFWQAEPFEPDCSKPHAHLATGMCLRAFAVHPAYITRPEVILAAERLKERLFLADKYNDRQAPAYWLKFQFPFWWTNLVTALDSFSKLGFDRQDPAIRRGLNWFIENQSSDGLWPIGYGSGKGVVRTRRWVGLAIFRVIKQYFDREDFID